LFGGLYRGEAWQGLRYGSVEIEILHSAEKRSVQDDDILMRGKVKVKKIRNRFLLVCLPALMVTCSFAASNVKNPALAGKWQLSWEARIGTESGTMLLEQSDSKLTGNYRGHISAPTIEGTVAGNKVTLNLDFQRAHPFTIIFTGTVDGDKMSGKFEIKDYPNGYDAHGENVRPSNYSWNAVRLADTASATRSENSSSVNPSSR
jgi:hypothetical protein